MGETNGLGKLLLPEAVSHFTPHPRLTTRLPPFHAGTGARTRMSFRTQDFKSRASASFAIPARRTDRTRNGGACAPPSSIQSGKRDSNPRPQPWQGCALPTELFPRARKYKAGVREQVDGAAPRQPVTPRACTANHAVHASSPDNDASPALAVATPESSTNSAATPPCSGA
jgi:hypothetical protein